MKRYRIIAAAACGILAGSFASAADLRPAYNISGIWRSSDPGTAQIFQNGSEVKSIYINKGFSHYFSGQYTSPDLIKGTQYRHNRSNGCFTTMALTFRVLSENELTFEWTGNDSNCDLREGQKGSGKSSRDRKLESETWY